jgi:endonuclease-3 related protein
MRTRVFREVYDTLLEEYGPQHWWPARTRFEVVVGAVLTQNTNWKNVERAIANLRKRGCLTPEGILRCSDLPELIRPSGYYNIKAERLRSLCKVIISYGGLKGLFSRSSEEIRKILLSVKGVGEETADSILLYAAGRPVFVVDAYTRRVFSRMGVIPPDLRYEEIQQVVMESIPRDLKIYNEYHALLVRLGKEACKKKNPMCNKCPINTLCSYAAERGDKVSGVHTNIRGCRHQ